MTDHPKPFRDLSDAEKGALLLAQHEGKGLQYFDGAWWYPASNPSWCPSNIYRIAPESLIPDSIDWSHVAPQVVAIARNPGAPSAALYEQIPDLSDGCWTGYPVGAAMRFASYRRGTVDWKDSLVVRPS